MTMIRWLAEMVMRVVAILSSPSLRDWVDASSRELSLIEDDWAALKWALGSAKILLQNPPVRLNSLTEVPGAYSALRRKIRVRTWSGCATTLSGVAALSWVANQSGHPFERTGLTLLAAAFLYISWQLVRWRAVPLEDTSEPAALVSYYEAELERQRRFFCGRALWSRIALTLIGALLLCFDNFLRAFANRQATFIAVAFVGFSLLAVPRSLREARKYKQEIDRIEDLRADC
jgi:hypothetical protein